MVVNGAQFLKSEIEKLSMLIIEGVLSSDEKSVEVEESENRFRSIGIGSSEIIYVNVYPNRRDLVNQN